MSGAHGAWLPNIKVGGEARRDQEEGLASVVIQDHGLCTNLWNDRHRSGPDWSSSKRKGRQIEEKLLERERTFKDAYCKLEPGVPDCKTSIWLNQFTESGGYLNQYDWLRYQVFWPNFWIFFPNWNRKDRMKNIRPILVGGFRIKGIKYRHCSYRVLFFNTPSVSKRDKVIKSY